MEGFEPKGLSLIDSICEATDLPSSMIKEELVSILKESGISADAVNLDSLRTALANYLQDTLLGAKEKYSA